MRWKLDPGVIAAIGLLACSHWQFALRAQRGRVLAGWLTAGLALLSPLCALSVSLFSARMTQHLVLGFIAAPLIASARPAHGRPWAGAIAFAMALWFWQMPLPYDLTLHVPAAYWAMHVSMFASAVMLWQGLLAEGTGGLDRIVVGAATSMQMALLGATLTLSDHAWYRWHIATTSAWGFSPLADQQLGGLLMWVPGGALLLWVALREGRRLLTPAGAAA